MTREQFDKKLEELIEQVPDLIRKRADHLWRSGAFDPEYFEDDFILPKAVMCACANEIEWQFHPLSKESQSVLANLKHF